MRRPLIITVLALAAVGLMASGAAADPNATVAFQLVECELTITSTKDISNVRLNGVTTEGFADGTTGLVIGVAAGDVVVVKSGVTTAELTVAECLLEDNGDGFD